MKYVYAVIGFAVIATIAWFALKPGTAPKEAPVLVVNQSQFSQKEFDARFAQISRKNEDRRTFAQSLAMQEVLLQDARNRGLDKEETFRLSMQQYYEQSLVKMLMDRRRKELKSEANPAEIDRYARFVNRKVLLTEFKINSPEERTSPALTSGRVVTERFDWLPDNVRYAIFSLDPGQLTPALHQDGKEIVYRLDGIIMEPEGSKAVDRDAIQSFISGYKTTAAVQKWMADLKKASRIEIHLKD